MDLVKWLFGLFIVMPLFVGGVVMGMWGVAEPHFGVLAIGVAAFALAMFSMDKMGEL